MKRVGTKIYYCNKTGNIILIIGQRINYVNDTTKEEDFVTYTLLQERVPETVGCIQLPYGHGEYKNQFTTGRCIGFDLETKELLFDFNPQEQLEELKTREQLTQEITILQQQLSALGKVLVQSKLKEGETV